MKCWTCVEEHLDGKERGRARYNVSGLEYCVKQFQYFMCTESCGCNVICMYVYVCVEDYGPQKLTPHIT